MLRKLLKKSHPFSPSFCPWVISTSFCREDGTKQCASLSMLGEQDYLDETGTILTSALAWTTGMNRRAQPMRFQSKNTRARPRTNEAHGMWHSCLHFDRGTPHPFPIANRERKQISTSESENTVTRLFNSVTLTVIERNGSRFKIISVYWNGSDCRRHEWIQQGDPDNWKSCYNLVEKQSYAWPVWLNFYGPSP